MLTKRMVDWTQDWKQQGLQEGLQQGLHSERRLSQRLIRRRFGEAIAVQSVPALERIEQPVVFEDLGEELFDCADETALVDAIAGGSGGKGYVTWLNKEVIACEYKLRNRFKFMGAANRRPPPERRWQDIDLEHLVEEMEDLSKSEKEEFQVN
jgi:hypothetical protein